MKAIDAISAVANASGTPTTHIGPMMDKGANYFSAIKSRGSTPKADTVAAMAETCGYKLVLAPRSSLPPDAIVIDPPE